MNRLRDAVQEQPSHAVPPRAPAHAPAQGDERDVLRELPARSETAPHSRSVLEAAPGNASQRLGRRLAGHSPIVVFLVTTFAGWLILAALMIGLGFLLVDVVLPFHGIGSSDEAVNAWLARHRSPSLDDASFVGTSLGDIPFIPALAILMGLVAVIRRRWRVLAFVAGGILVEVATYRVTSLIVHRRRPGVPRLDPDHLPVNQSFPSGHVAASAVVYIGLAVLLATRIHSRRPALALWALAIALPLVVALSRMYRGMHHPTDVAAGLLMGLAALAVALFATRAAGEAAAVRSRAAGDDGRRA